MLKNLALITGASSGIGKELAKVFAREGYDLILVARRQERLMRLSQELSDQYHIQAHIFPKDLSKQGAAQELYQDVKNSGLTVHSLVNNAGIGLSGPFMDEDLKDELSHLETNLISLTMLCRLFGSEMKARGDGAILNVASTAAFQPGPYMATYYAGKSYVVFLSEALHEELKSFHVKVSVLCPGPTQTEFFKQPTMNAIRLSRQPFMAQAVHVAESGYAGLMANKAVIVPGLINRLLVSTIRMTPRFLARKISGFLNGLGNAGG